VTPTTARWAGRLAVAAAFFGLALFPLTGAGFYTELVSKVMILAIFAMSLDLLVGYTGMVSFGHAAYYGIGAYVLGLATPKYDAPSFWLTLAGAVAASTLAAALVGALVVRVKGVYFIMVTLAFAQLFHFVFHDTPLGRGSDGISLNLKPDATVAGFTPFDLGKFTTFYYLVLVLLVLVYLFLALLLRSPLGRALQGIKSNEHRMLSLGFPVNRYKLAAFTVAGGLAGVAGYLNALQFGFVNPELLSWHQSGNALLMIILGGLGRLYGGVAGAFAFVLLQELFQQLTDRWQLPFGLCIVLLVVFLPGGLGSLVDRLKPKPSREPFHV
jgi:branched-chain amino acid transport system permease protein